MFISISRYIFLLGYLSTVEIPEIARYPYVNDKYIYVLILTIQIDTETYIIICSVMKMVLIFMPCCDAMPDLQVYCPWNRDCFIFPLW